MKRYIAVISLAAFVLTGTPFVGVASTPDPSAIRVTPPAPKFTDAERQSELARRRAAVAAKMADKSTLVMWSAEPRNYAGDVDFMYRQENNHFYLTNLRQTRSTLVIVKNGDSVSEYLFLPKRNPQFETWNGRMYSNEDATRISGLAHIIDAAEQTVFFTALGKKEAFASKNGVSITASSDVAYLLMPNSEQDSEGRAEFAREADFAKMLTGYKVENARPILDELRHIKSPYELKMMQHAIDITTEAQMRSMAMVGRAKWEYEVQAEVEYTFRRRNADYWGYPSIVGCGPNATTLHYVESQGAINKNDLLLMDVGAEYDHYTADVTRTYPVSGKFSKEQAEIYKIVYDAQEAVAKATKPGATMAQLGEIANNVIKDGLFKLGLITDKNSAQVRIWYMHGLGHWLGMNVHDVGRYGVPLKAGMIFTNEPGIYIRGDALDYLPDTPENKAFIEKVRPAFEKYRNIGVRIEDDMLVTESGVEWMTKNLPRKLEDVESFMARATKEMPYTAAARPVQENIFVDQSIGFVPSQNMFYPTLDYPAGKTLRRGSVTAGKNAAYAGSNHYMHSHTD